MESTEKLVAVFDGDVRPALPTTPELSGLRNGDGFIFERHSVAARSLPTNILFEHCYMLPAGPHAVEFRCRLNGRRIHGQMEPGKIQFRAAGDAIETSWNAHLQAIFVAIPPSLIFRKFFKTTPGAFQKMI